MSKLVLFGNSVNRLTGGGTWTDVLSDLGAKAQLTGLSMRGKPLPIVYEHVVSRSECSEQELKEHLANSMSALRPNQAHHRALAVAGRRLLTSNSTTVSSWQMAVTLNERICNQRAPTVRIAA